MTAPMLLTASQTQIWRGQELTPLSPLYNMVWRIDLSGPLETERFTEAFDAMVAQSDAMRLRVWEQEGQLWQCADSRSAVLEYCDLSASSDVAGAVQGCIDVATARPFDLGDGVWRAQLIRIGEADWVFVLVLHHIATDAGSGALLWQRLVDTYAGRAATDEGPSFAGYVATHTAPLPADTTAYWTDACARAATPAAPYGRARAPQATMSHRVAVKFGATRSSALDAACQEPRFRSFGADMSRYTLLATLFVAFLMRVKDSGSITLATPAHNRRSQAERGTAGLLIEMLPLTVSVDEGATLSAQFKATQTAVMGWMKHAHPGAITHATGYSADAALNYIPTRFAPLDGVKTHVTWCHAGHHDRGQDLRLHVHDFNDTGVLSLELDAKADVFSKGDAEDMAQHFMTFCDAALADPDRPLTALELVARDAPTASVAVGQITERPVDVLVQFRAVAAQMPDAVALAEQDRQLTYGALDAQSDRYAAGLQAQGSGPGQGVTVFASRRIETVVALLGVLKAGCYFVPMPSDTPSARLTAILDQLNPSAVVVDDITAAMAPAGHRVLAVKTLADDGPAPDVPPCDLCYAIFTSGSTGTPKGVHVGQEAFARYITWAARSYGPAGPKSYPLCTALGFDLTLTSIFVPLTTGGTVRIYPEPAQASDLSILQVMADDAVDVVKLTPAHLGLAVQAGVPVMRIGTLILGGEALTTQMCRNALTHLGAHLEIINEYGPTEATVGCMRHRFDPTSDTEATVPIGRPADDTRLQVVDHAGHPVPQGVVGELAIGGRRLARGYHRDVTLTDARFVTDPDVGGGRVYLSGDRVRMNRQGVFEYLGRADTQMKLSGVRIEPAEITGALLGIEGIADAAVHLSAPAVLSQARHCLQCGLSSSHPDAQIDGAGICQICHDYAAIKDQAGVYFETPAALHAKLAQAKAAKRGTYDAIMLLSGGKDSAYAMYRLAEITRDVLVLTLDNGFISDEAKDNIRTMTTDLGLEHRFLTTAAMNAIFRDSLERFSNVCQGCFKTVYALSLKVARDEGIPAIVTGLSRGQFFETRLTTDLFAIGAPDPAAIDTMVDNARRAYHAVDDAVARELGTADYIDDALLAQVSFIDIYRYLDVSVSEIYAYLAARSPWRRPSDTGRSTNCVINDLGIYVHTKREQFHNYALPYSWDVRLGHKTRAEAMAELDDELDDDKISSLMRQIGYDGPVAPRQGPALVAYIVEHSAVRDTDILHALRARLPREAVPAHIVRLQSLPLTSNGKIDISALPAPRGRAASLTDQPLVAPQSDLERLLVDIFAQVLGLEAVGVTANFYDLGGDSISAIQISMEAQKAGLDLEPTAVFQHQTVGDVARHLEGHARAQTVPEEDAPLVDLDEEDAAAVARTLAQLGRG